MRALYTIFMMLLWAIIASGSALASASVDVKLLALAIMISGAMAGGDGK